MPGRPPTAGLVRLESRRLQDDDFGRPMVERPHRSTRSSPGTARTLTPWTSPGAGAHLLTRLRPLGRARTANASGSPSRNTALSRRWHLSIQGGCLIESALHDPLTARAIRRAVTLLASALPHRTLAPFIEPHASPHPAPSLPDPPLLKFNNSSPLTPLFRSPRWVGCCSRST